MADSKHEREIVFAARAVLADLSGDNPLSRRQSVADLSAALHAYDHVPRDGRTVGADATLVMRHDLQRDCWIEVGRSELLDPGAAFREVVLGRTHHAVEPGEYLAVPLLDAPHLAIELNVRDLKAAPNPSDG